MADKDILDLLVRRGVNPNKINKVRINPQELLNLNTTRQSISPEAQNILFQDRLNSSPVQGIRTSTVPEQSTIDMLFRRGNQSILNEVNSKSFMDKLAQRAKSTGKSINSIIDEATDLFLRETA